MILQGANFNSVFNNEDRQDKIKRYGQYYLDLKLETDGKVVVYDDKDVVDIIPNTYNFEGLFDRRTNFKLILRPEGYYVVRYVDIHAHSAYSILDGMTTLDEMVESIEWCGTLSDHGNMFGFYKFNNKMIAKGKKPILGFEAYIKRKYQSPNAKRMERGHLLILIKNEAGYRNAIKLSTLGYIKGEKTKKLVRPAIEYEDLKKYSEGLIVTSACFGGDIPRFIHQGQEDIAYEIAKEMKDIFGDDFYIEIQRHKMEDEVKVNSKLIKLARELDIKIVAGLDSHYLRKEDRYYQEILLANNRKTTMSDPNRWVFEGEGYHRLTSDEMVELFSDIPECLDNTLEIADKIEFELKHDGYHLPKFDVPDEFKIYPEPKDDKEMDANQYEYMYHLCREGMKKLGFDGLEEYEERLDFELEVIKRMGYSAYFLIVWDFIDYAKRNGILVGPGRGSACGSLVAYTLAITDVDPIRYGLLFERFLSPDRVSMPDKESHIIIDFEDNKEHEGCD